MYCMHMHIHHTYMYNKLHVHVEGTTCMHIHVINYEGTFGIKNN